MNLFQSKELIQFKRENANDMDASERLIADLRKAGQYVIGHDDLLVNGPYVDSLKSILLKSDGYDTPKYLITMTLLYIRYISSSTIPELEREGTGSSPQRLAMVRRQCDLIFSIIKDSKHTVLDQVLSMKKNGKWPSSFNDTDWLVEFKNPDSFMSWTIYRASTGDQKLAFASSNIVSRIGSLFRFIFAISKF